MFKNRTDAGRQLAQALRAEYADRADAFVLALPRGGVPVAFEIARTLHAPLDIFVVRKIGVPGQEELAMGAIASGGIVVYNKNVIQSLGITEHQIARAIAAETQELQRREELYCGQRAQPSLRGRTVIVVDDGLATGATMKAAVMALQKLGPARVVVAVPVAAIESVAELETLCDAVVCLATPRDFYGVGQWYEDFRQTTDAEVRSSLERAREFAYDSVTASEPTVV